FQFLINPQEKLDPIRNVVPSVVTALVDVTVTQIDERFCRTTKVKDADLELEASADTDGVECNENAHIIVLSSDNQWVCSIFKFIYQLFRSDGSRPQLYFSHVRVWNKEQKLHNCDGNKKETPGNIDDQVNRDLWITINKITRLKIPKFSKQTKRFQSSVLNSEIAPGICESTSQNMQVINEHKRQNPDGGYSQRDHRRAGLEACGRQKAIKLPEGYNRRQGFEGSCVKINLSERTLLVLSGVFKSRRERDSCYFLINDHSEVLCSMSFRNFHKAFQNGLRLECLKYQWVLSPPKPERWAAHMHSGDKSCQPTTPEAIQPNYRTQLVAQARKLLPPSWNSEFSVKASANDDKESSQRKQLSFNEAFQKANEEMYLGIHNMLKELRNEDISKEVEFVMNQSVNKLIKIVFTLVVTEITSKTKHYGFSTASFSALSKIFGHTIKFKFAQGHRMCQNRLRKAGSVSETAEQNITMYDRTSDPKQSSFVWNSPEICHCQCCQTFHYLPIFCMINICENLKHLHDAYIQKKGLCKHKHQEGENFYKEKGIRTFRLSQGRSEKHGFIILQKIRAVPQNQGYSLLDSREATKLSVITNLKLEFNYKINSIKMI
ncbi:hypothetical protein EI555_007201, partial [Monodon monoceros]